MKPIYRTSSLTQFEFCGYSFCLDHIEKKRRLGNYYTARGNGCHKAREYNLRRKILTFGDMPVDILYDTARDEINRQVRDDEIDLHSDRLDGLGRDAVAGFIIDSTLPMVRIDRANLMPMIQPREVEITIVIRMKNYPFDISMRLDTISADNYIDDLKTTQKKWAIQTALAEYQPKIYPLGYKAHCVGLPFEGFRYHIIHTTKKGKLSAYSLVVNPSREQTIAVLARFEAMHKAIQKGVFSPCHSGHWKCSPEYCEFYRSCKYATG